MRNNRERDSQQELKGALINITRQGGMKCTQVMHGIHMVYSFIGNLSPPQRHVACRITLHIDRPAIVCREDERGVLPHICPLEGIHDLVQGNIKSQACDV